MIFTITEDCFMEMNDNYEGYCIACGEVVEGVEPDARNYKCESCGQNKGFGLEELLLIGKINII